MSIYQITNVVQTSLFAPFRYTLQRLMENSGKTSNTIICHPERNIVKRGVSLMWYLHHIFVVQTSLFAPFFDTGRQKILDIKYDGMRILSQKPYFFANLPQPYAQFRLSSPSVQLFALQKKDSVFIFC